MTAVPDATRKEVRRSMKKKAKKKKK